MPFVEARQLHYISPTDTEQTLAYLSIKKIVTNDSMKINMVIKIMTKESHNYS
jgi:hypothetical protein